MDKPQIVDTPRYIVAKYVPDLSRMEPKNIGVIVWSKYGMRSRFIAEKEPGTARLDKRSIPGFVANPGVYEQWVGYWTRSIQRPAVEPVTGGELVPTGQPEVLDVLKATSSGNFMLQGEGLLIDQIGQEDLDAVTEYLFSELVKTTAEEPRDRSLQDLANTLLNKSGIINSPNFSSDATISYKFGNVQHETKFSHAYRNGQLSLMQRIPNIKLPNATERVQAAAFKFERVVEDKTIEQDHGFSLVSVPLEQLDERIEDYVNLLSEVSTVFNLVDEKQQADFLDRLQIISADER